MDVQRVADPAEFAERTSGLLLQDEPRNNLILGLLGVLREQPHVYPEFSLWIVEADGDVVGAALRTPPYGLVLGPASPAAAAVLVAVGVLPEIDVFAAAWGVTHGVAADVRFEQGIYALERLREPRDVPGAPRRATEADLELLRLWLIDFLREALHENEPDEVVEIAIEDRHVADHRIRQERFGARMPT